jgi:hypothetical protein
MGYNTTVFILNDRLNEIQNNPQEFVDQLTRAIQIGKEADIIGQTTVMPTMHADVDRVYYTHGNSIIDLSSFPRGKSDRYIKYWLEKGKWARSLIQTVRKNFELEMADEAKQTIIKT